MKSNSQEMTLKEVVGPIITFLSYLIGLEGRQWFEAFKLFLRKENPWTNRTLHLWKSIFVGGLSVEALIKQNEEKGFRLSDDAKFITKSDYFRFKTSDKSKKVDFAMKSLEDFGFTGTTFLEWQEFIHKHPLFEICQPEDVYYLRIIYNDQPIGGLTRLCMDTISLSLKESFVFDLEHNRNGLKIGTSLSHPTSKLLEGSLWIVRLRK